MTDITKCFNGCDKQHKCYRWTALSDDYQSYSDFKPDEKGNCEHFLDKDKRKTR